MSSISTSSVDSLRSDFRGEVLLPSDNSRYDEARTIWNAMFNRKPAIIARCVATADVVKAVNFARENELLLAVRGGGHNAAGFGCCDDGMMLDLSPMRRVHVDPKRKTARVDGGALLGDVDAETQLYNLAVSSGINSRTGVAGLTLGGGFGWVSRKYGLSLDNLLSAEVVTADGELVTASEDENPDLFWAIRGGGGNFGVVTSFDFRCADLGPRLFSGLIIKRFEDAEKYLQFHHKYAETLPDDMTLLVAIRHAPPFPFLPPEMHGKMIVAVIFTWLGDSVEGDKLIQPIRSATPSIGEKIGMNSWISWQKLLDAAAPYGCRNYWKSHFLSLNDDSAGVIVKNARTLPSIDTVILMLQLGGEQARIPDDSTAYAHRQAPYVLNLATRWDHPEDDERCMGWARSLHTALNPYARGTYVNFLMDGEGEKRIQEAYSPAVWQQLVDAKTKWDPTNLFRLNQNIKPAVSAPGVPLSMSI